MEGRSKSADKQLKAYIDRILRCREAEDEAKADTKAVYKELAAEGYEKAVVGQVVNYLRKREKDGDNLDEQSAKFDLYLDAYQRPSHAYARVSSAMTWLDNHGKRSKRPRPDHEITDKEYDVARFEEIKGAYLKALLKKEQAA